MSSPLGALTATTSFNNGILYLNISPSQQLGFNFLRNSTECVALDELYSVGFDVEERDDRTVGKFVGLIVSVEPSEGCREREEVGLVVELIELG